MLRGASLTCREFAAGAKATGTHKAPVRDFEIVLLQKHCFRKTMDDDDISILEFFNRLLGISELELLFLFNRYDWDAATTMGFLQNYGLAGTNHCTQVNTIIFLSVEMICSSSLMKVPC